MVYFKWTILLSLYSTVHILATSNSTYGKPRRAVHLSNVHCTGDEDSILDCSYNQYLLDVGKSLLDQVEVAGVDCGDITITTASGM